MTCDLFRGVDRSSDLLYRCAENVEYRSVLKGDIVIQQGEAVDSCCVLMTGKINVKAESTNGAVWGVGTISAGEHFGDQWMIMSERGTGGVDCLSHQSYMCETACQLFVIDDELLAAGVMDLCRTIFERRLEVIRRSGMFELWEERELCDLACLCTERKFGKGVEVVEQGEPFEFLGILTKGVCGITKFADRAAQIRRNIADLEKQLKRLQVSERGERSGLAQFWSAQF